MVNVTMYNVLFLYQTKNAMAMARLITGLQRERAEVALHMLVNLRSGEIGDLSAVFAKTDRVLVKAAGKAYGNQKVFSSKLRFQVKLKLLLVLGIINIVLKSSYLAIS